jgi:hypothetical protein
MITTAVQTALVMYGTAAVIAAMVALLIKLLFVFIRFFDPKRKKKT